MGGNSTSVPLVAVGMLAGMLVWGFVGLVVAWSRTPGDPALKLPIAGAATGAAIGALTALALGGRIAQLRMWRDDPLWRRCLVRVVAGAGVGSLLGAVGGVGWSVGSDMSLFWAICMVCAALGGIPGLVLGVVHCFVQPERSHADHDTKQTGET